MRCQVVKLSIVGNLNAVTLLTTDIEAFKIGAEYEVSLTPAAPRQQPPVNTAQPITPQPPTPPAEPKLTVVDSTETAVAPIVDKPTSNDACKVCYGTGVVALFVDGSNTGKTEVCSHCSGKGLEPQQT